MILNPECVTMLIREGFMSLTNTRTRLLLKYLTPTILSNLSVFLFTIIDGIFVGQGIGSDALGAVNIVFPYVMFFNAFVMLTTIGGLTVTAIRMGKGDTDGANEVFMHSTLMSLFITAIFSAAAIFCTEPLCRLMGASDTYIDLAVDYLFWYGVFLIPCGMLTTFNGFVRNDSRPALVSAAVITATALNIFGDWLLIYPIKWGLKGAAIATGAAQTIGMCIVLTHFIFKKGKLNFHRFKIQPKLAGKIIVRGLPECIAQFCTPLTTIIVNIIIVEQLGTSAENAFSIICYVACFSIAIFYGVADGLQPLFGRCYGSGNFNDLKFYKRTGLIIGGAGSFVITLIIVLLGPQFCDLYAADPETRVMVLDNMARYAWGFVVESFTVIISSYLYSTTRTKKALIINITRSFVANTVITIFAPMIFGAEIVWYTFGLYETVVAILAFVLMFLADKGGIRGAVE